MCVCCAGLSNTTATISCNNWWLLMYVHHYVCIHWRMTTFTSIIMPERGGSFNGKYTTFCFVYFYFFSFPCFPCPPSCRPAHLFPCPVSVQRWHLHRRQAQMWPKPGLFWWRGWGRMWWVAPSIDWHVQHAGLSGHFDFHSCAVYLIPWTHFICNTCHYK